MLFAMICVSLLLFALSFVTGPLWPAWTLPQFNDANPAAVERSRGGSQKWTIGMIAVALPLAAGLLYWKLGNPDAINAVSLQGASSPGPPPEVARAIEKARAEPQNLEAQIQASAFYSQIGRYADAIVYLSNANRLAPNNVDVIVRLGVLNIEDGQIASAQRWLSSALQKQPANIVALEASVVILLRQGDVAGAKRMLDRFAAIEPNSPDLPELREALSSATSEH